MQQKARSNETMYNPNKLFDALLERLGLANDGALSRKLKVATGIINDIRKCKRPVAGSMLLWISDITGITVSELRLLMGDRRAKCRLSCRTQR